MKLDLMQGSLNETQNSCRQRARRIIVEALACCIASLLVVSSASAATLDVVGGQLLGATDVDVGGDLYDVEFLDGTCLALFDGCDDVSDFEFQSLSEATLASQALLDQVFLDGSSSYDSNPALTRGCPEISSCYISTPFVDHQNVGLSVQIMFAKNTWSADAVEAGGRVNRTFPTSGLYVAYAVWSPVPEPGSALLIGLGLGSLAGIRRRVAQ